MDYHNDLQKISDKLDSTREDLIEAIALLRIDVAKLEIKSGLWGFAAGSIPSALFLIFKYFAKQ